jgi:heptosyltransferase-3
VKSALFIRGGAIGDFILTLPGIHAFREQYPDVRVEIMGYPHIAQLAAGRFYAQAISSLDRYSVAGFFARNGNLDTALSQYFASFDLIVSFLYDPDHHFVDNLKRAGAKRVIVAEGMPSTKLHATDHLAQWLPEVKVSVPIRAPKVYPTVEDISEAEKISPNLKVKRVALHIGSGSPNKNWEISRFAELAIWLTEQGISVLVLDGPADHDVQKGFWKTPASENCIRCQSVPLPVLAALLQKCAALVGHDSGISHLAAAVGTPTVAIFGATNPRIWAPRGEKVSVVQRGVSTSMVKVDDVKEILRPLIGI